MKFLFRNSSFKSLLLNILIIFSLFSLLSFVFFYEYLPYATNKNHVVTVPDIRGQNLNQATNNLRDRDLQITISADSGYNVMTEPLTVLDQYPRALSKVKVNRSITVKLNARIAPLITFPDLTGSTPELAKKQLSDLGIRIGKLTYTPDIAINSILSAQINNLEIHAGEKVRMGSLVNLTIGVDSTSVTQ
ncbi:MAG TPA: PASTA domain-containing protein [Cyclobacteriaceae bacterium]|jgi:beta-lactam-binding protein with PASTA domain|nr:PASTA domain-containing protein [Cyclobacteriaceae bacterium]